MSDVETGKDSSFGTFIPKNDTASSHAPNLGAAGPFAVFFAVILFLGYGVAASFMVYYGKTGNFPDNASSLIFIIFGTVALSNVLNLLRLCCGGGEKDPESPGDKNSDVYGQVCCGICIGLPLLVVGLVANPSHAAASTLLMVFGILGVISFGCGVCGIVCMICGVMTAS